MQAAKMLFMCLFFEGLSIGEIRPARYNGISKKD
jgi:hypothetical protein